MPDLYFDCRDRALPLYTADQLRALEQAQAQALPPHTLMARAGRAAAALIAAQLAALPYRQRRVWLAVGPGNNGGDALIAAAELNAQGIAVKVCMPVAVKSDDAREALCHAAAVPITDTLPSDAPDALANYPLVVDGLFGIGVTRPLSGIFAVLATRLTQRAEAGATVIALDVPSGLNSDTGNIVADGSAPGLAVRATQTLTFIGAKPGLFTAQGRDYAGDVYLATLDLPIDHRPCADAMAATAHLSIRPCGLLNAAELFAPQLPRRAFAAHKGNYGSVAIVGGAGGLCGAPILAARAALYAGAGKVHAVLLADNSPPYDPLHPELMLARLDRFDADAMTALAIGPGLGCSERAASVLAKLAVKPLARVLDADALNLLAADPALAQRVMRTSAPLILTPHPLEAARLLGLPGGAAAIQRDRLAAARALAQRFRAIIVLKGSGTVIADPSSGLYLNPTGNAGLATGGTGDVLTGLIGALLAQRIAPLPAVLAAVFLHGRAADAYIADGVGPAGLTAGEIAPRFRQLLNRLMSQRV